MKDHTQQLVEWVIAAALHRLAGIPLTWHFRSAPAGAGNMGTAMHSMDLVPTCLLQSCTFLVVFNTKTGCSCCAKHAASCQLLTPLTAHKNSRNESMLGLAGIFACALLCSAWLGSMLVCSKSRPLRVSATSILADSALCTISLTCHFCLQQLHTDICCSVLCYCFISLQ